MADNVIVIGKRTISDDEYIHLHLIGYAIAKAGKQLHTTTTPGAPRAVADGYEDAGGKPTFHTKNLGQIEGETIAVLDADMVRRLNASRPGWDEQPTWTYLDHAGEIADFADITAGWMEASGRSLVQSGDG